MLLLYAETLIRLTPDLEAGSSFPKPERHWSARKIAILGFQNASRMKVDYSDHLIWILYIVKKYVFLILEFSNNQETPTIFKIHTAFFHTGSAVGSSMWQSWWWHLSRQWRDLCQSRCGQRPNLDRKTLRLSHKILAFLCFLVILDSDSAWNLSSPIKMVALSSTGGTTWPRPPDNLLSLGTLKTMWPCSRHVLGKSLVNPCETSRWISWLWASSHFNTQLEILKIKGFKPALRICDSFSCSKCLVLIFWWLEHWPPNRMNSDGADLFGGAKRMVHCWSVNDVSASQPCLNPYV